MAQGLLPVRLPPRGAPPAGPEARKRSEVAPPEPARVLFKGVLTEKLKNGDPGPPRNRGALGAHVGEVVWISGGLPEREWPPAADATVPVIVEAIPEAERRRPEVTARFHRHTYVLRVGQRLEIHNDGVARSFHFTSRYNGDWSGSAQPGAIRKGVEAARRFELRARLLDDCDETLRARVIVMEHPLFAVTDASGRFELRGDLPPGSYELRTSAGHRLDVVLPEDAEGAVEVEFPLPRGGRKR